MDTLIITQDRYYKLTRTIGIQTLPRTLLKILLYFPDLSIEKLYYNGNIAVYSHDYKITKHYRNIIIFHRSITRRKNRKEILQQLKRKSDNLIFFDIGDITGGIQNYALKICDQYWTKQIYKNKEEYNKGYQKYSKYLDVFSEKGKQSTKISDEDLEKIKTAWNIAMSDHYLYSNNKEKILRRLNLTQLNYPAFKNPETNRRYDINTRLRTTYPRKFVEKHRKLSLKTLSDRFNTTPSNIINKEEYMKELENSKIVLSPFGNGEICYRDFEAIINGATLIKPNMSHIKTWPDIYKPGKTYVSVKWDFSNLNEQIEDLLNNPVKRKRIAKNAQEAYKPYYGEQGIEKLKQRFSTLLGGIQ